MSPEVENLVLVFVVGLVVGVALYGGIHLWLGH